ncbi:ionotropic receptor 21a [Copidosoma floridanum]|uniref:ionotropic receptor 21a n=1 Tax=Copidosoma floridanum TaxID=29053 RepID=UPI0006C94C9A|nr:ionotropic receptor 21a [Copidosoma floridanum]
MTRVARQRPGDCSLAVVYEPSYEQRHAPGLRQLLKFHEQDGGFSSVTWLRFDDARGPIEPRRDVCTDYILLVEHVSSVSRVLFHNVLSNIVVVTADSPWEVKAFLRSQLARSYLHLLVVAHSTSQRTPNGTYVLYGHKLYADGSGSSEPLLLASWINDSPTVEGVEPFPDKLRDGFMGHRMLVSVVENPPFAIRRPSAQGVDDATWDGLEVRLLRLAAAQLNFTVEFAEPRSTATSPLESAKKDVLLGESSMCIGGVYMTLDLAGQFDATTAHTDDCAAFISLASTALPKYRAILGPFQPSVWLFICVSYFVLMVPLSFNSNYSLVSLVKHPKGLNHMFWFIFSTYTNSFVVKNPLLDHGLAKNSTSMLLGIYWVFTIIVTACYTGSIVSFITLPAYPSALESAKELQAYRYRIGTLDHGSWVSSFNVNATEDPFLKKLFRKIEYVPSVLEGIQNASRAYFWPYAFLASRTSLDYIVQTDFAPTWATKRTLMHISEECFVRYNVVQLYPNGSLYTRSMNDFVLRATETGLIGQMVTDIDWQLQRNTMLMNKQITKRMSQKIQVVERNLTVEDTQGMFMLLGIGFLLALAVLSVENFTGRLDKRRIARDNAIEHLTFDSMARSNVHFLQFQRAVSARRSLGLHACCLVRSILLTVTTNAPKIKVKLSNIFKGKINSLKGRPPFAYRDNNIYLLVI